MSEIWMPISGYKNCYEVSSLGRIKSVARLREGRPGRICRVRERIVAQGDMPSGHLNVSLSKDGVKKTFWVHILVLSAFAGPCPAGLECLHGDGNPKNNAIDNLRWGTPLDNACDRDRHGTTARGERNAEAQLTESQVRDIKSRLGKWGEGKRIAREYGVSESLISDIKSGRTWAHVQ